MRIISLVFFLLAYTVLLSMISSTAVGAEPVVFPSLEIPDREFIDLSGGCGSFTDCVEYQANVLRNIGTGFISAIEMVFGLVVFVVELFALMVGLAVTGIEGAPWFVNVLLTSPILGSISIIIYKLIRSGSSSA